MIRESMLFMYFGGGCTDALDFYREVFAAELVEKTTYGEAEMTENDTEKDLIMNSVFRLGGMTFCASDVPDGMPLPGDNLSVWLEFDGQEALYSVYARFQREDCGVQTPLAETFWGSIYAKVQDPFGVCWELNYQKDAG